MLVGLATKAAHHAVTLDGFRRDVHDIAHRHLDLLALLAKLSTCTADHQGDQRQNGEHHQGQLPVHPEQGSEQENHRHTLAKHHLDCIGGGSGDHGHVEGDARNQVA
ncbi:hypothetical protein D3C84_1047410 [compost metagenome]